MKKINWIWKKMAVSQRSPEIEFDHNWKDGAECLTLDFGPFETVHEWKQMLTCTEFVGSKWAVIITDNEKKKYKIMTLSLFDFLCVTNLFVHLILSLSCLTIYRLPISGGVSTQLSDTRMICMFLVVTTGKTMCLRFVYRIV